jgi:hypothetical protein
VKVTLIVQFAAAATDVPQVLDCAKSLLLVPVTLMPVMDSAALPLFVSVTVEPELVVLITWSLKVKLETERLTAGSVVTIVVDLLPPPHELTSHTEDKRTTHRAPSLRRIIVASTVGLDYCPHRPRPEH